MKCPVWLEQIKFEQDKADPSLEWRGSANQIIHQFKL